MSGGGAMRPGALLIPIAAPADAKTGRPGCFATGNYRPGALLFALAMPVSEPHGDAAACSLLC